MKVELNPDTESFFRRCRKNMAGEQKNRFLGRHVTPGSEHYLQRQMHAAGFAEFAGEPETWPSLFLSASDWEASPYHSSIRLEGIRDEHFSYETDVIRGQELFNADMIQKDPQRELNDSMKLRALDRDCRALYLLQDEEDWMLDAPSEAATNDRPAARACGHVLTFGLGIGYYLFMAMRNPAVTDITVIEQSPEVIAMFRRFLQPQFPAGVPLTILQGDAFDYFRPEYLSSFDSVYVDIWKSSQDGLAIMTRLLEQCLPDYEKASFWIEDSCLETVWTLVFLHFQELACHEAARINPDYEPLMKKVRSYFRSRRDTLTASTQLKDLIYDGRILREILAQHPEDDAADH